MPRPALPSGDTREGFAAHLEWERTLFDARYAVVSWPREYGGREASLWEWLIFEEEYYAAGAPQRVTQNGIFLLAPTIFEFGTQEQKDRILPKMAVGRADVVPGVVGAQRGQRPRRDPEPAVRDDAAGGWRLSGQKTWTTRGAFCTHLFGLFRSDPAAERHRGPHLLPRRPEHARRHRAAGRTARRRRGLRRGVPRRRVRRPTPTCSARRTRAGPSRWRRPVPSAASRCARPAASWRPRNASSTSARARPRRARRRRWRERLVDAWIDAEAYRWQTFWTVTRARAGRARRARSRAW